jgi:hypothetical protein
MLARTLRHQSRVILLVSLVCLFPTTLLAQPAIQWQVSYGGTQDERANSIIQTTDSGYAVAGWTHSTDWDIKKNQGIYDFWILKLKQDGSIQWQKTLGGNGTDKAYSIVQTTDKGYIVAGSTNSTDGDVVGLHGGANPPADVWVVKLDSVGNVLWKNVYGGSGEDVGYDIIQTKDEGYILTGLTHSNDGDVEVIQGGGTTDVWVVKLDKVGKIVWEKTYGGTWEDRGQTILEKPDGGYIFAGYTSSNDGQVSFKHRLNPKNPSDKTYDFWVVSINDTGKIVWEKTYGGNELDGAYSMIATADGGYAVAGYATSNDGDVTGLHGTGFSDAWVIKIKSTGELEWQKALGGTNDDAANSIIQTREGGYLIAGVTYSTDGDVAGFHGGTTDIWTAKLSATGALEWQKPIGGSADEGAYAIIQTFDRGFVLAGSTASNDGDAELGRGGQDIWIVKLAVDPNAVGLALQPNHELFSIYPNPTTRILNLQIDPITSGTVSVQLFNAMGQIISLPKDNKASSLDKLQQFDLSKLPSGQYFVRVFDRITSSIKGFELIH